MKDKDIRNKKDRIILKSIISVLIFQIITVIFGLVFGAILGVYNAIIRNFDLSTIVTPSFLINIVNISSIISPILSFLIIIRIFKIPISNIGRVINLNKTGFRNIVLSVGTGIGIYLINLGLSILTTKVFNLGIKDVNTSEIVITSILSSVIVIPIFEEVLFRGIIFGRLKTKYKILSSIIIQGIIFGVFHLRVDSILYAIIMGIILGFVFEKTKSIYTIIISHVISNFLAIMAATFFKIQFLSTTLLALSILIGFIIVIVLYRFFTLDKT